MKRTQQMDFFSSLEKKVLTTPASAR